MSDIIYPEHYRIFECRASRWFMKHVELFYSHSGQGTSHQDIQATYGISPQQVAINLFRIKGGQSGFYLANLKQRKYYYCGSDWEDIRTTLQSLGIGRLDPIEN